ncbi:reverse transcriptase [Teladorsagia circumcincta]|uniref:Reverse transcriptase n=1 Tax=Teladorsagia circumcincta TaxID=45464 RepID=A0A2G9U684_TELCI|nr:reverse transcriptase [Teladorsagia circumcincta]
MDSLPALLKAVQQQLDLQQRRMDEQGAAITELLERMSASPASSSPVVIKDKHALFDSLHRRMEKFSYDPDRGRTFDIWLRRYQYLFDHECDELEENRVLVRLLVSRLDEDCHQMLTAAIAPKHPSEPSWNEIVEVLDRQFGSAKTLFRRRFECFEMRYEGQEFNNYELLVKTKCTNAELDTIDFDGLQCLFYVAGFQGPDVADYRTRLLRKLDQSEKVTLKDLDAECQLIKSYKEDSRMLEGDPSINFVRRNNDYGERRVLINSDSRRTSQTQPIIDLKARNRCLDMNQCHDVNLCRDKTNVTGYAANGPPLKFRGCFETDFVVSDSSGGLLPGRGTCYVTEDDCNVFGMPWIKQLPDLYKAVRKYQIHRTTVDHVSSYRDAIVANLRTRFPTVFKNGLGRCTTTKATIMLRADAIPVFKSKRPVPYANIAALDKEIDRLLAEDALSPVTCSKWAAPIVVVKKANGTLRLCADYSTGLNDALMLHQHPLPTPDDVFTKLNGGTVFTQIDFADAYLQVEVDEASKELLTINTHRGLLSFNRLPFGVKSAPGIFQQIMDSMIAEQNGCAAYLDDVIVTGRTMEEHTANLEALFERIHEFGFRVRVEKCSFLMPQIRYLGNIIDANGRHPDLPKQRSSRRCHHPETSDNYDHSWDS